MKAAIFVLLVAVAFAAAASILPAEEYEETEHSEVRLKRATCDLLSFSTPWGSLNHSACAAHCLSMRKGFKGGRCKDGVCHCRK